MMVKRGRSWSPPNIKYDKSLNHTTLHYYTVSFIECGRNRFKYKWRPHKRE